MCYPASTHIAPQSPPRRHPICCKLPRVAVPDPMFPHLQYRTVPQSPEAKQLLTMLIPPQTPQPLPQPRTRAPPRRAAASHIALPLTIILPFRDRHISSSSRAARPGCHFDAGPAGGNYVPVVLVIFEGFFDGVGGLAFAFDVVREVFL